MDHMTRTREILGQLIAYPTVSADSNLALIEHLAGLLADAGAHDARARAQALILGLGFRGDQLLRRFRLRQSYILRWRCQCHYHRQ